jgi:hypothetical protein
LSATEERGFCVLEQDGTRLYCASTIHALADWCRDQRPLSTQGAGSGFRDYMARQ